jgi:hypothetical protein
VGYSIIRMVGNENSVTYFDAVLDNDMKVLFNGIPEDTKQWLRENPGMQDFSVCIGKTMHLVSAREYLDPS